MPFHGGWRGSHLIRTSITSRLSPFPYPLFPVFSCSCALFCTHQKDNSFLFKRFHTLCEKHPGWGEGSTLIHPLATESALPPMVKWRKPLCTALRQHGVRRLAAAFSP